MSERLGISTEELRAQAARDQRNFDFDVQGLVSKGLRDPGQIAVALGLSGVTPVHGALKRNALRTKLSGNLDWYNDEMVIRRQAAHLFGAPSNSAAPDPNVFQEPKFQPGTILRDTDAMPL